MIVDVFPSGPYSTNAYLLVSEKSKEAIIIDPSPQSSGPLLAAIKKRGCHVLGIYLTHSHWDHIADVHRLKEELPLPVYIHPEDAPNLENPGHDRLPLFISLTGVKPDGFLFDGEKCSVGALSFTVIHTPGHSPGGVCFYFPDEKVLMSGDTLFKESIGRLDLPGSDAERMWSSLKKLETLPPETVVYPGHGPKTTIGAEDWLPRAREIFS